MSKLFKQTQRPIYWGCIVGDTAFKYTFNHYNVGKSNKPGWLTLCKPWKSPKTQHWNTEDHSWICIWKKNQQMTKQLCIREYKTKGPFISALFSSPQQYFETFWEKCYRVEEEFRFAQFYHCHSCIFMIFLLCKPNWPLFMCLEVKVPAQLRSSLFQHVSWIEKTKPW